jgi:peptidyl-prolyl cis-trans isomerase SurA
VKYLLDNRISINRIVEKDNGKYKPVSRTERNRNQRVAFGFSTNSRSDVEKQFNATKPDRLSVLEGYFRKGDNKIMDSVEWKVGVQAFEKSNRYYHLDIKKIDAPRPKSLDEARGAVINDYQAFLEKEWLNRLKQTFSVSVNDDEIKKLVK